jgi:hypothetical protein
MTLDEYIAQLTELRETHSGDLNVVKRTRDGWESVDDPDVETVHQTTSWAIYSATVVVVATFDGD